MFHGAQSMRFATARVTAATLVIGLATFITVLPSQVAGAADDVVNTCAGSGTGSLPAVVAAASSGDTIMFSVTCPASSPITLGSTIDIDTNLTIDGPGANNLAVSGDDAVQVFDITSATISFSGITIEDGNSSSDGGGIYEADNGTLTVTDSTISGCYAGVDGGGIYDDTGTLTVTSSSISGNVAGTRNPPEPPSGAGGGIYDEGVLSVANSTFSGNDAGLEGGGILGNPSIVDSSVSDNISTLGAGIAGNGGSITDSTLSDNVATAQGGGVYIDQASFTISASSLVGNYSDDIGGGIALSGGALTLTDSTLSDDADGNGSAIINDGGTSSITGSTIAGNYGGPTVINADDGSMTIAGTIIANSGTSSEPDCDGSITDGGYNLDDDGSCGFSAANGSESDVNPDLGPLQDNGGPTDTQAPALGSPVLNRIPVGTTANGVTLCPGTDQRGVARPQGTECDIGAVELVIPKAITSPNRATDTAGSRFSFTIDTSGTPVPKITEKGALPKRLNFTDNADGTATISGKTKMTGVYHLTITATFGKGTSKYVVSQAFTLTVNSA